jgi:gluconate 2-dehydrogenase gamma chain
MDRREAIKRTALLMGSAVSASAIMGIMNGCTPKPSINWKPTFFSEEQGLAVSTISEIILPKTETAGAIEVGVPSFIDELVNACYSPEEQIMFTEAYKAFNAEAKAGYGKDFNALSAKDQEAFVYKAHEDAIQAQRSGKHSVTRPFVMQIKELTMLGYFSSQVGATEVLQYQAVPGEYKGCVPLSEAGNGKTWAT